MARFNLHGVDANVICGQNQDLQRVHQSIQVRHLPLHWQCGEFWGVSVVAHTAGNAGTWPVCTLDCYPPLRLGWMLGGVGLRGCL